MLEGGGVLSYMPPTSGLSLHRTVAERIFPLPESYPLTAVADQVITRFAPLLTSVLRRQEVLAEHRLHGANSYGRSKITAEFVLREITTCRTLWNAQRDFLESTRSPIGSPNYSRWTKALISCISNISTRACRDRLPHC